jgi:hypothetical protein
MSKDMQARLTVWPVTALAFVGGGWIVYHAIPLQQGLQGWLERDLYWPHNLAQWPPILLGIPLFAFFVAGIILIVRVSAIAFKAIQKGWL